MIKHVIPVSILGLFNFITERKLGVLVVKAYHLWCRDGFRGLYRVLALNSRFDLSYKTWMEKNDTLSSKDKKQIINHIERLNKPTVISVLMPVYNTPPRVLKLAIKSVRDQLYPYWELCIVDDASTQTHVKKILEEAAQADSRIKIVYRDQNGHISEASNTALELATGEFIALLDHDDELAIHALYMVAVVLDERPYLDMIYSDEDKIDKSGRRFSHYFKPDWNPDLLTAQNMVSHLGVYRSRVMREVGGFRKGLEGAQDWDIALRVSEVIPAAHIYHIPFILYHWRSIKGSTAYRPSEKSYAINAALTAVTDHVNRMGLSATVSKTSSSFLRIRYDLPTPAPLVSIIISTRNGLDLLRGCIDSLLNKTSYTPYEILVVDNQSDDPETLEYLYSLKKAGTARVLNYDERFNYSAINNFAAKYAQGSILCLMENDIEVISEDWLEEMVGHASRKDIGAVGAMLYYPDNTIQHAGVLVGMGGCAGHLYSGMPRGTKGYACRASLAQNVSAITAACLVVRKSVFEEAGGLDSENLGVAFNDIDFCLKVMECGYRNLWTPFAEFYHHESASRGLEDTLNKQRRFQVEIAYMRSRWPRIIDNDPAYNPNLTLGKSVPYLAFTPRLTKPWVHIAD